MARKKLLVPEELPAETQVPVPKKGRKKKTEEETPAPTPKPKKVKSEPVKTEVQSDEKGGEEKKVYSDPTETDLELEGNFETLLSEHANLCNLLKDVLDNVKELEKGMRNWYRLQSKRVKELRKKQVKPRAKSETYVVVSSELAKLLGIKKNEQVTKNDVLQRIWKYAEKHELKNKNGIACDSAMKKCFQTNEIRLNSVFKEMNKLITTVPKEEVAFFESSDCRYSKIRPEASDNFKQGVARLSTVN